MAASLAATTSSCGRTSDLANAGAPRPVVGQVKSSDHAGLRPRRPSAHEVLPRSSPQPTSSDQPAASNYVPTNDLRAPSQPPTLAVDRTVVHAFYWIWGDSRKRPPTQLSWRGSGAAPDWRFSSRQMPIRLVIDRYSQVGPKGIPSVSSADERECAVGASKSACYVSARRGQARVEGAWIRGAGYYIVNAEWVAPAGSSRSHRVRQYTASWAVRIT